MYCLCVQWAVRIVVMWFELCAVVETLWFVWIYSSLIISIEFQFDFEWTYLKRGGIWIKPIQKPFEGYWQHVSRKGHPRFRDRSFSVHSGRRGKNVLYDVLMTHHVLIGGYNYFPYLFVSPLLAGRTSPPRKRKKNVQLRLSWTHEMMPFGHMSRRRMTTVRHTSRNVSAFFLWCANITPNECATKENPKVEGLISYIFNKMMLLSAFCPRPFWTNDQRTCVLCWGSLVMMGWTFTPSTTGAALSSERGMFLSFWPVGNPLNRPESVSERSADDGPGPRRKILLHPFPSQGERAAVSNMIPKMWT